MFIRSFLMVWCFGCGIASAAHVAFVPRELFQVRFGDTPESLGSQVQGSSLLIPREFTLDETGHVYINDLVKHRIARFSTHGQFQQELRYIPTAAQVFAHPDTQQNLWLLISDPARGFYYGVYSVHGKKLRDGLFAQYNHFRLHLDDAAVLHLLLSSTSQPNAVASFLLDDHSLLLKKEAVGPPPMTHHAVRRQAKLYFADQIPGGAAGDTPVTTQISNENHQTIASIRGAVIHATDQGELYTRVQDCEIRVYEADGTFEGQIALPGPAAACTAIRFDAEGNLYQLTGDAQGMRLIEWQRG